MGNIFSYIDEVKKLRKEISDRNKLIEVELIKIKKTNLEFQKRINELQTILHKIETLFK